MENQNTLHQWQLFVEKFDCAKMIVGSTACQGEQKIYTV